MWTPWGDLAFEHTEKGDAVAFFFVPWACVSGLLDLRQWMLMTIPRLRHNILALGAVQAGNLLVPLLTLPYLTRVLGVTAFGHVVFVQVVMSFLILLVDFGFSLSATRQISEYRADSKKVARVFSATWVAQWLLLVVGWLVLWGLIMAVPAMAAQAKLYAWGFGLVIGHVLFPIWLLQGLESMKAVAAVQLLGKLAALPLLFSWVKTPDDGAMALVFFSASSVLTGCLCLAWIARERLVVWSWPDLPDVVQAYREGGVLFFSRVSISLYTTLVPLVVGMVAGPVQLGYFNLADKVKGLVQAMIAPVSQALFPRMSLLYKTDVHAANALLKVSALSVGSLSVLAGMGVWLGADLIVRLLAGVDFAPAAQLLRWMAFVPFVVAMSNMLGIQVMLPLGRNRAFASILSLASLLCVVLVYPVVAWFQGLGAAQLVLFIESVVSVVMAFYLYRSARVTLSS
jgi:O-antigen/teichoic acid export membrane protein